MSQNFVMCFFFVCGRADLSFKKILQSIIVQSSAIIYCRMVDMAPRAHQVILEVNAQNRVFLYTVLKTG